MLGHMNGNEWTAARIPDLAGRTFIVTRAGSGPGLATTRQLARHGARVVLAVRDEAKGRWAAAEIGDGPAGRAARVRHRRHCRRRPARLGAEAAHQVLAGTGVYAAHVPIFAWIGSGGRKPSPGPSPGAAGTSTASGTAPGIPTTPGDIAAHPRKEPT